MKNEDEAKLNARQAMWSPISSEVRIAHKNNPTEEMGPEEEMMLMAIQ